jgi:dTDP-4-amino-4,6-dideoxygalactose transaminase
MRVPFFDLHRQQAELSREIAAALQRVCESTAFTGGEEVESFEKAFAAYCGARYCVGVSSGTSALHLALLAIGVGPGDEVITTPLTFVATAAAISYCGATPILVDCDPETLTLAVGHLADAITPRTKAILPVHLHGRVAHMDAIDSLARSAGIKVIEDAAQAHGAAFAGRKAGTFGQAGCFSFYPSKNLGAYGDAGAVITDDAELAQRVRGLRSWGSTAFPGGATPGFNYRLASVQAAVLRTKMAYLERWNSARRAIAYAYNDAFQNLGLTLPLGRPRETPAYYVYALRTQRRDQLRAWLEQRGIGSHIHYATPVHLQPAYRRPEWSPGTFPVSEAAARDLISLPLFPEMRAAEIETVCRDVCTFFEAGA